jgi:hypothetical protein
MLRNFSTRPPASPVGIAVLAAIIATGLAGCQDRPFAITGVYILSSDGNTHQASISASEEEVVASFDYQLPKNVFTAIGGAFTWYLNDVAVKTDIGSTVFLRKSEAKWKSGDRLQVKVSAEYDGESDSATSPETTFTDERNRQPAGPFGQSGFRSILNG